MSILDLDVTAKRDPGSIRSRQFATVRKGYDPDQVRSFLDQVATWMDDLETDLASTRAEVRAIPAAPPPRTEPEPAIDPYAALGTRVAEVLRVAEEHAVRITEDAEASVQRMLDEAREESQRMRARAQEEADAVRQSAQEYSETTRRAAQEEADRVREDAANALQNARVEAERTVAGLSERRSALAAELLATRSRLMGIVSQLEEESEEEEVGVGETPEAALRAHPTPATSFIPPDDPRRDPIPPEIPSFVPPPAPPRVSIPRHEIISIEDSPNGSMGIEDEPAAEAIPDEIAGGPPRWIAGEEPGEIVAPAPIAEASIAEASIAEGSGEPSIADEDAGSLGPATEQEPADGSSFLQWTNEEAQDGPEIDMSLPDFPLIDIPSLEAEEVEGRPPS